MAEHHAQIECAICGAWAPAYHIWRDRRGRAYCYDCQLAAHLPRYVVIDGQKMTYQMAEMYEPWVEPGMDDGRYWAWSTLRSQDKTSTHYNATRKPLTGQALLDESPGTYAHRAGVE